MSVNLELLTKAAKVYDCSEPVEGMKPKMQYEEHKDLTPDEFSREHTNNAEEKSSAFAYDNKPFDDYDALRTGYGLPKMYGLAGAGLGALTGGLYGASTAKKGKRTGAILRGLLGGALTGGAGGLGAGFAVRHVLPEANRPGIVHDLKNMGRLLQGTSPEEMIDKQYLDTFGKSKKDLESSVGGAALLGGGAGLLGGGLLTGAMMPEEKDDEDTKKSAALRYGARAAHAILPIMERQFKKQSASPFDLGFTQSGAPTASWANKGYNPHQAINTPAATTPSGHMGNANRARFQFATAGSPQAKIDAQTAFTQAARATNSSNVALGGKPQYSPTQQPMQ